VIVVFLWIEGASPRLAKAQKLLEESILAQGLRPVRFPAGRKLCLFGDVLALGRKEAGSPAFVWCNSDVILTKNPFDVPDPSQVYGFRRQETPGGQLGYGVDMYYIPVAVWDRDLCLDVPALYLGTSYVDRWISRAMQQSGKYEDLTGYIDHPSHPKSGPANDSANSYYRENFRSYNRWAKRRSLEKIDSPPYLLPGLGHVWGVRDAIQRWRAERNRVQAAFSPQPPKQVHPMNLKPQPFFIVGASRSGTTMFRLMLTAHPKLSIPQEAWFLGRIVSTLDRSRQVDASAMEFIRGEIVNDALWGGLQTPETVDRILKPVVGQTLDRVIDAIFRGCGKGIQPGVRWGEKSPRHSYIISELLEVFPRASFVHMLRDGRDACASMAARGWYEGSFRRICEHWASCVESARSAARCGPSRYIEVHFEDLVTRPDEELTRVSKFLGVETDARMFDHSRQAKEEIPDAGGEIHKKLLRPLDAREIGKWKSSLTLWQEAIFLAVAGKVACDVGYADGHRPGARALLPLVQIHVAIQKALRELKVRVLASRIFRNGFLS